MVNYIALAKLRKWESEIQFMNLIREVHERGELYRTLYGDKLFHEMIDKVPAESTDEMVIVLLMAVVVAASMMLGLIVGAVLVY
jgi:hypothetical protein